MVPVRLLWRHATHHPCSRRGKCSSRRQCSVPLRCSRRTSHSVGQYHPRTHHIHPQYGRSRSGQGSRGHAARTTPADAARINGRTICSVSCLWNDMEPSPAPSSMEVSRQRRFPVPGLWYIGPKRNPKSREAGGREGPARFRPKDLATAVDGLFGTLRSDPGLLCRLSLASTRWGHFRFPGQQRGQHPACAQPTRDQLVESKCAAGLCQEEQGRGRDDTPARQRWYTATRCNPSADPSLQRVRISDAFSCARRYSGVLIHGQSPVECGGRSSRGRRVRHGASRSPCNH